MREGEKFVLSISYLIFNMAKSKKIFTFFSLLLFLTALPAIGKQGEDYLSVTGPCNLEFPKDHGPHPGYRTEWWYYTGNLRSKTGDQYGFQLTFFRSRISPPGAEKNWPRQPSAWRTQQIYLAHAAVSDIAGKQHLQAEDVSREALGMAGVKIAQKNTLVFLKNWSTQINPDSHILSVKADEFSYQLNLKPTKPPVSHGDSGYSLKGSTPERASCYYSLTRLEGQGYISLGEKTVPVTGSAWMDREFSTSPLEPGIAGWDWFSLQLSDQTEIMIYLLRKKKGGWHTASSGTFIDAFGSSRHLAKNDIKLNVLDTWKSPKSKAVYPARWRLQIKRISLDASIFPNLPDQEMQLLGSRGVNYWEGSVTVNGTREMNPVKGEGYVELTGYARAFDAPL
jgi:predicted secreted hydrolase